MQWFGLSRARQPLQHIRSGHEVYRTAVGRNHDRNGSLSGNPLLNHKRHLARSLTIKATVLTALKTSLPSA
jgi:hypothetical protein